MRDRLFLLQGRPPISPRPMGLQLSGTRLPAGYATGTGGRIPIAVELHAAPLHGDAQEVRAAAGRAATLGTIEIVVDLDAALLHDNAAELLGRRESPGDGTFVPRVGSAAGERQHGCGDEQRFHSCHHEQNRRARVSAASNLSIFYRDSANVHPHVSCGQDAGGNAAAAPEPG